MRFLANFFGFVVGMAALDYAKPRSRPAFRVALALTCLLLAAVNMEGCATTPAPYTVVNGGVNVGNEACSVVVSEENITLEPCK